MKDATLKQGNQVLTLILQKDLPSEKLQALIESGLLSDLLDANIGTVDREKFQEVLGLREPKKPIRKYRFTIRNLSPSQALVEEEVLEELGDVNIIDWFVENVTHFEGLVIGGGLMPQCNSMIVVRYTEK